MHSLQLCARAFSMIIIIHVALSYEIRNNPNDVPAVVEKTRYHHEEEINGNVDSRSSLDRDRDRDHDENMDWTTHMSPYEGKMYRVNEVELGTIVDAMNNDQCCIAECSLADFLLDSYFQYGSDLARGSTEDVPKEHRATHIISMINCGGITGSISSGKIPRGWLLKFAIVMGRVTLFGSEIKNMIEKAVWNYDGSTRHTEFLQVSGLTMTIDTRQPPGKRLQSAHVVLAKQELKDDEKYSVIISKEMRDLKLKKYGLDDNLKFNEFTETIFNHIVSAITTKQTISKKTDGRITILK